VNYSKHYIQLIINARSRDIETSCYYENHHIVPKCLGGSNDNDNMIMLKPEEHYVAHQLLCKIYPKNAKLSFACKQMANGLANRNNKLYGWVRRHANKHMSAYVKDKWAWKRGFADYKDQCDKIWHTHVIEGKSSVYISELYGMSQGNVQRSLFHYADVYDKRKELSDHRFRTRSTISKKMRANITPEQEQYRIDQMKKATYTDEDRKNRSDRVKITNASRKGMVRKKITCPHCDSTGGSNLMKRWHFDNCKQFKGQQK
jgi:hypothetical protein